MHAGRRTSHTILLALVLVLPSAVLLLPGCGGGDEGPAVTNPVIVENDYEPLYGETEAAIADAANAMTPYLASMSIAEAMTAVAAEMLADTCVVSAACVVAGDADPYLIAEFTNGIVFTMPVVRIDSLVTRKATELFAERLGGKQMDLALTGNIGALFIDLAEFGTSIQTLADIAKDVGYSSTVVASPTVESFANMDVYSLIHISTHGLNFVHEGVEYFGLLTSELRCPAQDVNFLVANEFQDVSVRLDRGVFILENEELLVSEETHYAITDRYIARHNGRFPDHTLVFADACQSAKVLNTENLPPLAGVLADRNVQVYLGWCESATVKSCNRAANYLYSTMFGEIPRGLPYMEERDPPIRPSTLVDAFTSLQFRDWHIDEMFFLHAELIMHDFTYGHGELMIRPSINQMPVTVDLTEGTQEVDLLGRFGSREGRVLICDDPEQTDAGGTELDVIYWGPYSVTVDLEDGEDGYVVVEVDGRRSNAHPLTKWAPDIDITGIYPSGRGPIVELTMHAVWRAEIVEERPMPEMAPSDEAGWASTLFGLDADCEYEYSGIFEDANHLYEYREDENRATIPAHLSGTEMFMGTVSLKPSEGSATIHATFSQDAKVWVTDKTIPEAQPVLQTLPVMVGIYIDAEMTEEGEISAGELTSPYRVSWPDIQPESPPVDSTGR